MYFIFKNDFSGKTNGWGQWVWLIGSAPQTSCGKHWCWTHIFICSIMSNEKENKDPNPLPSKKRKLSLSRKGKGRFSSVSEHQLIVMSKPQVPENTEKCSKWAMDNLKNWFEDCNSRNPSDTCPGEILTPTCSKELLNKWLCVFINETRSKTGYPYPPKTIQSLLAGILRSIGY